MAELLSGLVDARSGSISPFWPRTDRFRSFPMSGHFQIPPACPRPSTKRQLRTLRALLSRRESWSAGTARQASRRSEGPCPPSPVADPQTTVSNASTFITAMFMSGRLPSASAIRMTPTRGNGAAASILARIQANIRATLPPPSMPARLASCRLHLSLCHNGMYRPNGTPFGPADNPAYYI
jgi:hypothetical protein